MVISVRGGNPLSTCSVWVWAGLTSYCAGCWPGTTLSSWPVDLWGAAHHACLPRFDQERGSGEESLPVTWPRQCLSAVWCSVPEKRAPGLCLVLAGFCLHAHRLILRGVASPSLGFPGGALSVRETQVPSWVGRSPGGGHGNPLQYSCLESLSGQRSLAGYSPWGAKSQTRLRMHCTVVPFIHYTSSSIAADIDQSASNVDISST